MSETIYFQPMQPLVNFVKYSEIHRVVNRNFAVGGYFCKGCLVLKEYCSEMKSKNVCHSKDLKHMVDKCVRVNAFTSTSFG